MRALNRRRRITGLAALTLVAGIALLASACTATEPPSARINGERIEQDATFELVREFGDLQSQTGRPASVDGQIPGSFNSAVASQVLSLQMSVLLVEQLGEELDVSTGAPAGEGIEALSNFFQSALQEVLGSTARSDPDWILARVRGHSDVLCSIVVLGLDEEGVAKATEAAVEAAEITQALTTEFPDAQFQELCLLEGQIGRQLPGELGEQVIDLELGEVSEPVAVRDQSGGMFFVSFLRVESTSPQSMASVAFSLWVSDQEVWVNSRFGTWDDLGLAVVPLEAPEATGEEGPEDQVPPGLEDVLGGQGPPSGQGGPPPSSPGH